MSRLQKFYGGNPFAWLNETPIALIRAMLSAMPKLEAELKISSVEASALAFGSYNKLDANRTMADLQRKAFGSSNKSDRKPSINPAALAAMGIGVSIEEPVKDGEVADHD